MNAAAWLSVAATTIAAPFAATILAPLLHDLDARRQQRAEQEWLNDWHHGPAGAWNDTSLMDQLEELAEERHT